MIDIQTFGRGKYVFFMGFALCLLLEFIFLSRIQGELVSSGSFSAIFTSEAFCAIVIGLLAYWWFSKRISKWQHSLSQLKLHLVYFFFGWFVGMFFFSISRLLWAFRHLH
jgi:hypothetical protein